MDPDTIKTFASEVIKVQKSKINKTYFKKYSGNWQEICREIIADRWNGTYFEAGGGHLKQFWIRDFAFALNGLMMLGYEKEIKKNLEWALNIYKKNKHITTTIFKNNFAKDIYDYGADSLPFLLYSIIKSKNTDLIENNIEFFNTEINSYFQIIFDPKSNSIKTNEYFATMKDMVRRKSLATVFACVAFTQKILNEYKNLQNPVSEFHLDELFIKKYWNGKFFVNDLEDDKRFISADANILPYYFEIVKDREYLRSSIDEIKQAGLDSPFPLKYHNFKTDKWTHLLSSLVLPNYQGDTIWTFLSPIYIALEYKVYPENAKKHFEDYKNLIEKHQTYPEVLDPKGEKIFKGRFTHGADNGMLWAAMMFELQALIK